MARTYTKEELDAAVARAVAKFPAYFQKIAKAAQDLRKDLRPVFAAVDAAAKDADAREDAALGKVLDRAAKNRQPIDGELDVIARTCDRATR